jgi:hypothetical protein
VKNLTLNEIGDRPSLACPPMTPVEQFFFHLATRRGRRRKAGAHEVLWVTPWFRESPGVYRHFVIAGVAES